MTRKTRILVLVTILTALGSLPLNGLAQNNSVEMLGVSVIFQGVEYDADPNQSKWVYKVQSTANQLENLDRLVFQLCASDHSVVTQGVSYKTSHPEISAVGVDIDTEIHGLVFDLAAHEGPANDIEIWFFLHGNWGIDEIEIGGRSGAVVDYGRSILGPSCATEPPCLVDLQLHRRKDFRFMQPGTYASPLSVLELSGNGGAKVSFDEFGPAQSLSDPSSPSVHLDYSFGSTLAEADQAGWLTAEQLHDKVLEFNRSEIQGGVQIVLWVRSLVHDHHSSSDYATSGNVYVTVDCVVTQ